MPAERRTSSRISTSNPASTPSSTTSPPKISSKSKAKQAKSKLAPAASPSSSTAPSSSLLPPPAATSPKYLLLFKSLNVSSHNRISMPVLTSHVLAFLQAQSQPTSSASSSSSSSSALPPITVTPYLQSGNLILSNLRSNPTSNPTEPPFSLLAFETYLSTHAHIDSTLFLRTLPSLTHLLTSSPFPTGPLGSDLETKVHVVFLEGKPGEKEVEELRDRMRKDGVGEEVWWPGEVQGGEEAREVVLSLPNGVGKAKCGAGVVEKVLGMKTTMRGWRSLRACAGLLE